MGRISLENEVRTAGPRLLTTVSSVSCGAERLNCLRSVGVVRVRGLLVPLLLSVILIIT